MKYVKFSFSVLFTVLAAKTALSDYVDNYGAWKMLNQIQKHSYATGLFDAITNEPIPYASPDVENSVRAKNEGLKNCALAQNLTSAMLSEIIEESYRLSTAAWANKPVIQLHNGLLPLCKPYINFQRKMKGLLEHQ